ncbi:arginine--tRNA ligase, partial [Escherichia coli]|nr:arginine--tRNA ligase [Escherichia coli]
MTRNPLDTINERVSTAVGNAIVAAGIVSQEELPAITLEVPRDKAHGDLATNAAMQLTKIAKRNPRQIAEEIINHLNLAEAGIEKAEIAGPGFINFKLDKSYLYPVL